MRSTSYGGIGSPSDEAVAPADREGRERAAVGVLDHDVAADRARVRVHDREPDQRRSQLGERPHVERLAKLDRVVAGRALLDADRAVAGEQRVDVGHAGDDLAVSPRGVDRGQVAVDVDEDRRGNAAVRGRCAARQREREPRRAERGVDAIDLGLRHMEVRGLAQRQDGR